MLRQRRRHSHCPARRRRRRASKPLTLLGYNQQRPVVEFANTPHRAGLTSPKQYQEYNGSGIYISGFEVSELRLPGPHAKLKIWVDIIENKINVPRKKRPSIESAIGLDSEAYKPRPVMVQATIETQTGAQYGHLGGYNARAVVHEMRYLPAVDDKK